LAANATAIASDNWQDAPTFSRLFSAEDIDHFGSTSTNVPVSALAPAPAPAIAIAIAPTCTSQQMSTFEASAANPTTYNTTAGTATTTQMTSKCAEFTITLEYTEEYGCSFSTVYSLCNCPSIAFCFQKMPQVAEGDG
jgi:hypothetical protein